MSSHTWKPRPGGQLLDEHGSPFGGVVDVVEHDGYAVLTVATADGELQIFGNVETDVRSV